jgi:hypothetical protein
MGPRERQARHSSRRPWLPETRERLSRGPMAPPPPSAPAPQVAPADDPGGHASGHAPCQASTSVAARWVPGPPAVGGPNTPVVASVATASTRLTLGWRTGHPRSEVTTAKARGNPPSVARDCRAAPVRVRVLVMRPLLSNLLKAKTVQKSGHLTRLHDRQRSQVHAPESAESHGSSLRSLVGPTPALQPRRRLLAERSFPTRRRAFVGCKRWLGRESAVLERTSRLAP